LFPVLFSRFKDGEETMAMLFGLPSASQEQEAFLTSYARELQQSGRALHEAVIVYDSWIFQRRGAKD